MDGSFGERVATAEAIMRRTEFVTEPRFYIAVVFMILSPWYFFEVRSDVGGGLWGCFAFVGRLVSPMLCAAGSVCALLWVVRLAQRWQAQRVVRAAQL